LYQLAVARRSAVFPPDHAAGREKKLSACPVKYEIYFTGVFVCERLWLVKIFFSITGKAKPFVRPGEMRNYLTIAACLEKAPQSETNG
jgi:hypothetical protein